MQNNSTQKQLKFDLNLNDRPMQKSMIQLNNQNSPRFSTTRTTPIDFTDLNLVKKKQTSSQENATSPGTTLTNSQASFTFNNVTHTYQPMINRQNRKSNYLQLGTTSPALKGLLSPIKSELRYQGNPQDLSKYLNKNQKLAPPQAQSKFSNFQQEQIIQEIVAQVKERHLPQMLGKIKKEVYDDIYNLRLQFQAFRDETRIALKKNEGSLLQIKFLQNVMDNTSKSALQKQTRIRNPDEFSQLQTNYFLLEGKLNELQTRVSDHFKLNCQQFQRLETAFNSELLKKTMNISTIKSSLPPLLLQYKQMFSIKGQKTSNQIVFNRIIYHIDKMGYLLDHQNHYLLDKKGYQIKLEDKHYKILQTHHLIDI